MKRRKRKVRTAKASKISRTFIAEYIKSLKRTKEM
jgi:hypothetical protein